MENDRLRAARLKGLADERAAKQREYAAEQEAALAPAKRRAMLQWLVDHPGKAEVDYEAVWPHVRELLLTDEREAAIQRNMAAARASGRYGF